MYKYFLSALIFISSTATAVQDNPECGIKSKNTKEVVLKKSDAATIGLFSVARSTIVCHGTAGAAVGFILGKTATYIVCWGAIGAVSALASMAGPYAGKATFGGLSKAFGASIEIASNKIGAGTGIALGTATGPV